MMILYLQTGQSELEVRMEILVHVDVRARGHSNGGCARLRVVNVEGAERGWYEEQRCLVDQLCAFVCFQLHVKMATAQITHQKLIVSIKIVVL